MEEKTIINTVIIWLFPLLMVMISFLFKRDTKQKDLEIKEMKEEFRTFMKSQLDINQQNMVAITKISTIMEMSKSK